GPASQAISLVPFFFAFLYLRALNTNGLWRGWPPHHPSPSLAFGVAILICVLAAAAVARGAAMLGPNLWRLGAVGALLLSLAAVGLQAAQFSSLGFGPTDAAYASVFVGWTGLFALFLLPSALAALLLFCAAALLTSELVHVAAASAAFAAVLVAAAGTLRGASVPRAAWQDYLTLTKPRIMSLLLLTGLCG